MVDQVLGLTEIAALLGISRQRVQQLTQSAAFPAPFARLAMGAVWRSEEVEEWARETGRPMARDDTQRRAHDALERVLDAGAQLLRESGYDGFSLAEACQRASVPPGTLYGRVKGKAELFAAVQQRELDRITDGLLVELTTLAGRRRLSTTRLVGEVVNVIARHYTEEQALLRAFITRAAVDDQIREEGERHVARVEEAVVSLLMSRRADFSPPDTQSAVTAVYRLVVDSLSWRTAFGGDDEDGSESNGEWARHLRLVTSAYLLPTGAREVDSVETAEAES